MQAEDDAVEVGAHGAPVAREVEVVADAAAGRHSGVEVDEVQPAAALHRERHGGAVGLQVGDVAAHRVAAELVRDGRRAVAVDVGRHDRGALGRERPRRRAAEPASGARHQRHLPGQPAHRVSASARSARSAIASPNVVR